MNNVRIRENFRHDDVGEVGYGFFVPRVSAKHGAYWTEIATVCRRRKSFGQPGFKTEINWSGCGPQSLEASRDFVAALQIAILVAEVLETQSAKRRIPGVARTLELYKFQPTDLIG